jgi:hypothetical protein
MDEYQRDHIAQLEDRTRGVHTKTTGTWDGGLTRIIHERSIGLPLAYRKSAEYARKVAYSLRFNSTRSKPSFPYSSTKLGFVNNPG